MSDSEDDLECLRIHRGCYSSDSENDLRNEHEFEAEYELLKPEPIPSEILRQRSVYRPPSPDIQADQETHTSLREQIEDFSAYNQERIAINGNLKIATNLLDLQRALHDYPNKFQELHTYLKSIEEFYINIDKLNRSLKSLDKFCTSKRNLVILKNLISYFNAFVVAECLVVIRQSDKKRRIDKNVVYKSIEILKKIGNYSEIQEKIENINFDVLDSFNNSLNMQPLPIIRLYYDEIMDDLNFLFPGKIKKRKIRNRKKLLNSENKSGGEVKHTSNNEEVEDMLGSDLKASDVLKPMANLRIEDDEVISNSADPSSNYVDCFGALEIQKLCKQTKTKLDRIHSWNIWNELLPLKKKILLPLHSLTSLVYCDSDDNLQDTELSQQIETLKLKKHFKNSHNKSDEVGKVIYEILNNSKGRDIAHNSLIRQIEYSFFKTVNSFNILQYSLRTFKPKYLAVMFNITKDLGNILISFSELNELLSKCSSSKKLAMINKHLAPTARMIEGYFYAFFLFQALQLLKSTDQSSSEECKNLYSKTFELISKVLYCKSFVEKLKCRNDQEYIEFSNRVCEVLLPPLILPHSSKILTDLGLLCLEDGIKWDERENHLDLTYFNTSQIHCLDNHVIKTFILLQKIIGAWKDQPFGMGSVIDHMRLYFELLKYLEGREYKKPELGNFIQKYSENVHYIVSSHLFKVCVSGFYCFIICTFLALVKKIPKLFPRKEVEIFIPVLFNLMKSACPLDDLDRKLQYRNDVLYLKYCQSLSLGEIVVFDKPTSKIVTQVRNIFCGSNASNAVKNSKITNKLEDDLFEYIVNNLLQNKNSTKNKTLSQYFPKSDTFDKNNEFENKFGQNSHLNTHFTGSVICQLMNNPTSSDVSLNSITRHINYSILKIINLFNILKFSLNSFEVKNFMASLKTMNDIVKVCSEIEKFNDLLKVSCTTKLVEINQSSGYCLNICLLHGYMYVLLKMHQINDEYKSFVIQNIIEKLLEKYGIMEMSNLNPLLPLPQSISKFKEYFEFHMNTISICTQEKLWHKILSSNLPNLETKKIQILIQLEHLLFNWREHLNQLSFILENIKSYFRLLNYLEAKQNYIISDVGSFIHKFLSKLDFILIRHILRIFVSQFYAFIFYMVPIFSKKLPGVLTKEELDLFLKELFVIINAMGPLEKLTAKLEFRNDELYLMYCRDLFHKNGVVVHKTSREILEDLISILRDASECQN